MREGEYIVGSQVVIVDSESESDEDVVNEFPILRHPVDDEELAAVMLINNLL